MCEFCAFLMCLPKVHVEETFGYQSTSQRWWAIVFTYNWTDLFFGRLTFHFMGQTFQHMGHLGSMYAWRIGRFRRLKWVAVFTCNNEFTTGEFQKRDHLCEPSPSKQMCVYLGNILWKLKSNLSFQFLFHGPLAEWRTAVDIWNI